MKYVFAKTVVVDRVEFTNGQTVDTTTEKHITPGQFQSLIETRSIVSAETPPVTVTADTKPVAKK